MRKYHRGGKRRRKEDLGQTQQGSSGEVVNPLDFLEKECETGVLSDQRQENKHLHPVQGLFVVGTDAGSGKTVAICALGILLRQQSRRVVAFKPVQCGGEDARLFMDSFEMDVGSDQLTPYSFSEKVSPYFAFQQQHTDFDIQKVKDVYARVSHLSEFVFLEAPGTLFDPLTQQVNVADMVEAMGLPVVLVSPLRKGSLGQIMAAVGYARARGITVRGVLFSETQDSQPNDFFLAKVRAVRECARVPVIGIIPFLGSGSEEEIQTKCHRKISFKTLLGIDSVVFPDKSPAPEDPAQSSAGKQMPKKRSSTRRPRSGRRRNRAPKQSA